MKVEEAKNLRVFKISILAGSHGAPALANKIVELGRVCTYDKIHVEAFVSFEDICTLEEMGIFTWDDIDVLKIDISGK